MSPGTAHLSLLIERGRFKEAEALLRAELAKEPDDAGLHLHLSRVLVRLERPKEAQEAARRVIGLEPGWAFPHEVLAEALLSSSNLKEAEAAVKAAMEISGDDADLRALLARIYQDRNKPETALEHANAGLAIDPDHDTCRFFRTIALGQLNRHGEADESALGLLSDDPDDSSNHSARGWILLDRNAVPEAKMHFQEALRIDPDNEDARMGLVRCLQQGNPVLGWFLRLINKLGKVSFVKVLVVGFAFGILLPSYLKGAGQPEIVRTVGMVIGATCMLFFYTALVARPLFDGLLWLSREGRLALGPREERAVHWYALPMLAGFYFLGEWVVNGSKSIPFTGLGLLATAELLYEGFCCRHGWVRRRLLCIAAGSAAVALWFIAGPALVVRPLVLEMATELASMPKDPAAETKVRKKFNQILQVKNWGFFYPALLLYLIASYSDEIATALQRRAPDERE